MRSQTIKFAKARLDQFEASKVQWIDKDSTRRKRFVVRAGVVRVEYKEN